MPSSGSGSPKRVKLEPKVKRTTLLPSFRTLVAIYHSTQSYAPGNTNLYQSISEHVPLVLSLFTLSTLLYCDLMISKPHDTAPLREMLI